MSTTFAPMPTPKSLPVVTPPTSVSPRLTSVDALRGFDMMWIVGAGAFVQALDKMHPGPATDFLKTQLQHVTWEGFRCYDLIFPLFLFLVGVSIPFSLDKQLASGGRRQAIGRIVRRSLLLFALGIFYGGGFSARWPDIQMLGVLQRIALCYLGASLAYCLCPGCPRLLFTASAALLLGYWALIAWVPYPDVRIDMDHAGPIVRKQGEPAFRKLVAETEETVHGDYAEGHNLTNYIDFLYLPGKKPQRFYINEGLLSTLPAIALPLLGAMAALLLRAGRPSAGVKVLLLIIAGSAAVAIGYLWSFELPLIKRIWTSSFVLMAAGYSTILLAAFYLVVDVWKFQRWCQPLVWLGMNSITVYLAANIISFHKLAERFVGGDIAAWFNAYVAAGAGGLLVALASLLLMFALAGFLYRRKIFLRV
jgi:predicted acyltransferase